MQIWKDSKYAFQEKQGRGRVVRQSGKVPDYTVFFLLKASLSLSAKNGLLVFTGKKQKCMLTYARAEHGNM